VEPEHPSPDTEHESLHEEAHLPPPTLWPIGFAIGIVVILVGLVIDPELISVIGAIIAIVFGFLWARDATAELRGQALVVEPERRDLVEAGAGMTAPPADQQGAALPAPEPGAKIPRSRFLEGATLGLGGVIGGVITVPVAGFALLPSFLGQKQHKVDMGPVDDYVVGRWYVATFVTDPAEGTVSRRAAFVRNNGTVGQGGKQVPSFTVISNRCTHLGCPTQANGPSGSILGLPTQTEHTANGKIGLDPVVPAGYGCPCHGSQFDTEGNRTAGPAVRALDRYEFEVDNGHLILLSTYSVSHVVGTGAQAKIYKYRQAGPGEHVDGPEQWFYPLQPPHH
jgi:Rieske Fe-S protein